MKKLVILSSFIAMAVSLVHAQHYVGGDMSMLPQYELHNQPYLDASGNPISDLLTYVKEEAGWNVVRVRLFVEPQQKNQKGAADLAVCQDIEYVKALGARIKAAGLSFMLDFHYSDTWADPTSQILPASWRDCTTAEQKATRLYGYTKDCLQQLVDAGATPDLVQVGNEVSYGVLDVKVHPYDYQGDDWEGFLSVLSEGCRAVREVCPEAKIVIHTERTGNTDQTTYFYDKLSSLDYDVIGLSYYPIWHGTLAMLERTLDTLSTSFPTKQVQIVETAYNFQYWPSSGVTYDTRSTWQCSAQGQYNFIKDLITTLKGHDNVMGLYYWFPEEAGNGDDSDWNGSGATVMNSWLSRGLWWQTATAGGHWPVTCDDGGVLWLLKDFIPAGETGIENITSDLAPPIAHPHPINLAGQPASSGYKGVVIQDGRKRLNY